MMPKIYRHGDVLLIRRAGVCFGAGGGREKTIVLAHGEITGHAHRVIAAGATMVGNNLYLPQGGKLAHEEHGLIVLDPGNYDVRRQTIWTPVGVKRVRD